MKPSILALILLVPLTVWAGYEEGIAAYNKGDYSTAIAEIEPLAMKGNARAQYFIATLYRYGHGKLRDQAQAAEWFRKAAEQGHLESQYHLGLLYRNGEGVKRDRVAAHMWLSVFAAATGSYRDSLYAKDAVRKMEREMSEEDIARAKRMASEWTPRK